MSIWAKLVALGVLLAALTGAAWKVHHTIWHAGYDARSAEAVAEFQEAKRNIGKVQAALQADADKKEQDKNAQIRGINKRLTDALGSNLMLQRSAERLSGNTASCAGGTGAGLSRPDAGFLEGESARANVLRAALGACQQRYEAVRAAQPRLKE